MHKTVFIILIVLVVAVVVVVAVTVPVLLIAKERKLIKQLETSQEQEVNRLKQNAGNLQKDIDKFNAKIKMDMEEDNQVMVEMARKNKELIDILQAERLYSQDEKSFVFVEHPSMLSGNQTFNDIEIKVENIPVDQHDNFLFELSIPNKGESTVHVNVKRLNEGKEGWGFPFDVSLHREGDPCRTIHIEPSTTNSKAYQTSFEFTPTATTHVIPLRIIQTYKTNKLPIRMFQATQTFVRKNPDFSYIFYSDEQCRDFIASNFDSNTLKAFDMLIPGAFRADLFRLCELYINGGFYADISMICFVKLRKILDMFPLLENIFCLDRDAQDIYNAFIAATPRNKYIKHLLDETLDNVLNKRKGKTPLDVTGPRFIGKSLRKLVKQKHPETGFLPGLREEGRFLFLTHGESREKDFFETDEQTRYVFFS